MLAHVPDPDRRLVGVGAHRVEVEDQRLGHPRSLATIRLRSGERGLAAVRRDDRASDAPPGRGVARHRRVSATASPPSSGTRPTDCPGWTVFDNVAHMIGTERMLPVSNRRPAPDAAAADAPHVRNDIGKANEQWIATYRGLGRTEAARRVPGGHRAPARRAARDDARAMGRGRLHARGSRSVPRQFMAIRVFDCWYHDQDIREALDRPGFPRRRGRRSLARAHPGEGPRLRRREEGGRAARERRGVRRRGFARDLGRDLGAARRSRGAPRRRRPPTPTVRITTDRRTFARLAGGRWTGAQARARGVVRVEGDTALGDRVVDNMAFTI